MITITFLTNNNKTVTVPEEANLLRVSLREKGGIPFKCGGGICGTCRCLIEVGIENTDKVKAKELKHLNAADIAAGYRMACQTFVRGDVSVSWKVAGKPEAPKPNVAVPTAADTTVDPSVEPTDEPVEAPVPVAPVSTATQPVPPS
jgi:ferredoxin